MAQTVTSDKLKVFISYSRRDSGEFAEELLAGLELAGFAAFLDRHDIAAGEEWEARLGALCCTPMRRRSRGHLRPHCNSDLGDSRWRRPTDLACA